MSLTGPLDRDPCGFLRQTCVILLSASMLGGVASRLTLAADADPAEQQHWSYRPIIRPDVPPAARREWARNAIDLFVLRRLAREGIVPSPVAGRETSSASNRRQSARLPFHVNFVSVMNRKSGPVTPGDGSPHASCFRSIVRID
ncbi:MAG TPA: hypothetical protein DCE47_10065 [Planctomycetaceae bacterium]|nr:hypothetical protein [Planctomycetaceae bacterium]